MVRARFFKELLKVRHRQSCLALTVACGLCGTFRIRAACLLLAAITVIDHGLLAVLFASFIAGLGILLGTLDCGAGQRLSIAAQHWSKLCHHGLVGGDGTLFFSGTIGATDGRIEGSQRCPVMHTTFGHPCQRPPGVTARPPLSIEFFVVQVPRASLRSCACLKVPSACQGRTVWALLS
jgi:hypothetical protein